VWIVGGLALMVAVPAFAEEPVRILDEAGNVIREVYEDGTVVDYSYDDQGERVRVGGTPPAESQDPEEP
jgi:YD repeat-containing protein